MFKSGFAWLCGVLVVGGLGGLAKSTPTMGARLAKTAVPHARVMGTAPALNELRLGGRAMHVSPNDVSALPKSELSLTDEAARATDEAAGPREPGFVERATKKVVEEGITNVDALADLLADLEDDRKEKERVRRSIRAHQTRSQEGLFADPRFRHFLQQD
jgi:hypothetical protein